MLAYGREGPVNVRVVLLALLGHPVAVVALVAALGGLMVAPDHALAKAELASQAERTDGGFASALTLRTRDAVCHLVPLPWHIWHLIHFFGLATPG